ncbi:mitoguardin 2-like isoform X4 [Branchiostoma floridae]|uniref:Mitoguardin 2-like isoform X4 n=1 Tax=Branchiostoma floridae TaxID=7739 RepID=A0A9J7LL33_BRAFL|nr:mitoguardin 2-like isoform X4 [Branchiostoma floridae]
MPISIYSKVGFAVAVSVTLLSIAARYFRRRTRPNPARSPRAAEKDFVEALSLHVSTSTPRARSPANVDGGGKGSHVRTISTASASSNTSRRHSLTRSSLHGSLTSVRSACSERTMQMEHIDMAPAQIFQTGLKGMQHLEHAISCWEEIATMRVEERVMELERGEGAAGAEGADDTELVERVERLLQRAYRLQEDGRNILLDHSIANLSRDTTMTGLDAISELDQLYLQADWRRDETSSTGSFVSAEELQELQDDYEDELASGEKTPIVPVTLELYEAARGLLHNEEIPCRTPRTEMLDCLSNREFIAKLHCVRQAFQLLFEDETVRQWMIETGKEMISELMWRAEKDPKDFQQAFEDMLRYCEDSSNWESMAEELRARGVMCLSFYDVVLDFILLDAFDDLANPPSSVTAVVQNRWLSNGFKETALATAVWSVLKAKRRMLLYPDGFIAHFYGISEHVSPVLAWGFLGTDEELKQLCYFFKDQVQGFITDVFDFEKTRYSSVQEMADDIMFLARQRRSILQERLSIASSSPHTPEHVNGVINSVEEENIHVDVSLEYVE